MLSVPLLVIWGAPRPTTCFEQDTLTFAMGLIRRYHQTLGLLSSKICRNCAPLLPTQPIAIATPIAGRIRLKLVAPGQNLCQLPSEASDAINLTFVYQPQSSGPHVRYEIGTLPVETYRRMSAQTLFEVVGQLYGDVVPLHVAHSIYWLPSILKYDFVALRFVEQAAYERAAPLEVTPAPDVVTRVFMLFRGVGKVDLGRWAKALARADEPASRWRDVVGAQLDKTLNASLFRVIEWGGMEVL
ncbi:hypothetical protein GGF50DRAFT_120339 [Schizophyllum commune]